MGSQLAEGKIAAQDNHASDAKGIGQRHEQRGLAV
jgi:hypothetical protein